MRTALTIAGSDSSGGAGIQADLKTFAAHYLYGTSALTAVTAQNTTGVTMMEVLPASLVAAQIDAVAVDIPPAATKIGMLANADIVAAVADAISRHRLPHIVLDTVMVAKGGARLLNDDAIETMCGRLVPLAEIVTPNIPEAERLTGESITSVKEMGEAARQIAELGAKAVLVKGGHLSGDATDVLLIRGRITELKGTRLKTRNTHGTGCTMSAAIAARLAHGEPLEQAVQIAKDYVRRAIDQAPDLGAGHGPLEHFIRR